MFLLCSREYSALSTLLYADEVLRLSRVDKVEAVQQPLTVFTTACTDELTLFKDELLGEHREYSDRNGLLD